MNTDKAMNKAWEQIKREVAAEVVKMPMAELQDRAVALLLLERCAESLKNGIVGIGSPMSSDGVASTLHRQPQGWVVGKIGRPTNFDVEDVTLPSAITVFAKKLFS